jgi:two-component system chemotaxis response regulator CheV
MIREAQKFVLFPLGRKRFALLAPKVTELARPDDLQAFPHGTPLITGVLLRRGRIIPVLDVAQVLLGPEAPPRRFYLIANRVFGRATELTAIPVTGECELISTELLPRTGRLPDYVTGLLSLEDEIIEVLSLELLAGEAA